MTAGGGDERQAAGEFSGWIEEMLAALRNERSSDVACDTCTACCTSSQFIHVGPEETATISHIPAELLFPAPGMPRGHVLMGYDERGHCPMLIDNRCSIYEHRPRTCRTYDCRVFAAAGISLEAEKVLIDRQAQRWEFDYTSPAARTLHAAVRAAAAFLAEHPDVIPGGRPATPTQRAVLAVEVHDLFIADGPEPDVVRAELLRRARPVTPGLVKPGPIPPGHRTSSNGNTSAPRPPGSSAGPRRSGG